MNLRILMSTAPIVIFFVLNRAGAPAWVAILAGFAASTVVYYLNRKDRLIGALTLFGFVVVTVSSVVGIIWDSEKAYLASGPISDFLFVALYGVSIALRKPLIGGVARELFPHVVGRIPVDAVVFMRLSVAWALYDLVQGVARFYLLGQLSISNYIIWSRVASWPFAAALIGLTAWLIYREAKRHEPAPLVTEAGTVDSES